MKVLVGSTNAWQDSNAVGNTLSNWFAKQPDIEFANIYSRSEMPSNSVCKSYFRITEQQMLKNIFTPEKIGYQFELTDGESGAIASADIKRSNNERSFIEFVKKHSVKPVYVLSQILWDSGKWLNKKLERYIKDFNPDIFFSFATEPIVLRKRMEAVKKISGAKTVLFVADDVYTSYHNYSSPKKSNIISDFQWCMENADLIYGASKELCEEYSKIFGRDFRFLCKGCDVLPVKEKSNEKITLIYAGNLFYGRDETLAELVKAIENVNKHGKRQMELKIFTSSPVKSELSGILNSGKASTVVGVRPYVEVVREMNNGDIVLEVESFDAEEINKVRLSFSTKIIDCLQSGSCAMAIGPKDVSSMKYMSKIPGIVTVNSLQEIPDTLLSLSNNYENIRKNAVLTNSFAREKHDISAVRRNIYNDFNNLLKG